MRYNLQNHTTNGAANEEERIDEADKGKIRAKICIDIGGDNVNQINKHKRKTIFNI